MHLLIFNIHIYICEYVIFNILTLLEVALLDFPESESLLESDTDLESEELSSDELDTVSEELDVFLFLEIPFAFLLISSALLDIKK